ncbi:MAG: histidine phosphatase family protein [Ruminococcaceae bacterium]|nr:histidine phosphatase family protein [Oscillospiraceae bacterium]
MRILIIRHGDPDYTIDSLTEKGWREAELLSRRMEKEQVTAFYCSPLGRAQDTASLTLRRMNRTAETLPWLREFPTKIIDAKTGKPRAVAWDMLPADWADDSRYYDINHWTEPDIMQTGPLKEDAQAVFDGLDAVLARHGYTRKGGYYTTEQGNDDTIVFFCHFGVECVMLGHLLNISPMLLWHGFIALPTSVTEVYTEERVKGQVSFRTHYFGCCSHLMQANEPLSPSGCFCDVYEHFDQRHE